MVCIAGGQLTTHSGRSFLELTADFSPSGYARLHHIRDGRYVLGCLMVDEGSKCQLSDITKQLGIRVWTPPSTELEHSFSPGCHMAESI